MQPISQAETNNFIVSEMIQDNKLYSAKKYYEKVVVGQLVSDSEKSTKLICSEKESFNEN